MLARVRFVVVVGAALALLTSPLVAQTWSAEQQAVMAVVEMTWIENDAGWVTSLTHPEMLSWSNSFPMPRNQATTQRWS
ncbi:MAG TPA: hypothetical protein DC060_09110, partial [Gemmatimonadetes bacterium]|nr:hypothetical protein [Gemmatimonadota bacterium]